MNGQEKIDGITVGEQAAAEIIALRTNDGRGGPSSYTVPPPGPGVWQPTMMLPDGTMAPPMDAWMAEMVPFMLPSPDHFLPSAPPDLSTPEWATQFNEVKDLGGAMSMSRTPDQTAVAQFWAANGVIQYNTAFREVALTHGMGLLESARLLAMGNMVGTDTLIACFDAKYNYSFWRPVTAIRNADIDGNDATTADPMWMPLLMTPNHPEYTAGHACFASAQAEVFAQALGTQQIELDLTSDATGTTRHYTTTTDLRVEIVNARTWAGLHYRPSSEMGVALGQTVAQYALTNYFLSAPSTGEHAMVSGGIRKFVDGLPGLTSAGANNLGQYISVAVPTLPPTPARITTRSQWCST